MKIFAAQLNPIVGDLDGNTQKILRAIKEAESKSAELIVFPELCLQGYPPEDLLLLQSFLDASKEKLNEIAAQTKKTAVLLGCVREESGANEKPLYNSACLMQEGKILGFQDKTHLPTYDVFDERRYFSSSEEHKIWEINGKRVLITICEDIWSLSEQVRYATYSDPFLKKFKNEEIDLIVNLSASPYHFNKPEIRQKVFREVVSLLKAPLLFCNQVGANDSLLFDGHTTFIDSSGESKFLAPGFTEGVFPVSEGNREKLAPAYKSLEKALVMGVRDYFQKQSFTKACLGLSGGVDSALVLYIAQKALGKENVKALLMPSRFTSKESVTDALELAANLGVATEMVDIEPMFNSFLDNLEPHFQGKPYDTTEENLQARIRGMILMAFSNKFGYLLLSTGNKSEMALGYSTLYGDLCGGLAVISDVPKTMVYALCEAINEKKEVIPKNILLKAPSAELRENQKDSDTLPPYEMIDEVLDRYVVNHEPVSEIIAKTGFEREAVSDIIHKVHQNEYKRRQAPPGLRVTEKAFSKGRVFPIVQKWR